VLLQDGSVFQLNDHSRVRVNLTESTRHVLVESGEVFFEVSPDFRRPFDVQAGTAKFIAKGTAFSVRKDEDGKVETTVTHGIVCCQTLSDRATTFPLTGTITS
jgi:transmembrane sensor